jgi:ubiquitin-protein ligase
MPLSRVAEKRIPADILNVQKDDMKELGIYYMHDEADMSKGTALIIGPPDTPYMGGYYFFGVKFPDDYPYSPPAMTSLTQDGVTRFNPNMYRDGKVCLSLLNTWHVGDKWSGCQTLKSVLLCILTSVLTKNPLQNEPGYENQTSSELGDIYNRMLTHSNLLTSVLHMIQRPSDFALEFYDEMTESFHKNRLRLIDNAISLIDYDNKTEVMDFFRMRMTYKFSTLADKIRECVPRFPPAPSGGSGDKNTIS